MSPPSPPAFTVRVDHTESGTGVSAADRARTVGALAVRDTSPDELRRAGHVFPLRAFAAQHGPPMPTGFGEATAVAFRGGAEDAEHLVLVHGDVSAASSSEAGALVLRAVAEEEAGAVVHLRGTKGVGSGRPTRSGCPADPPGTRGPADPAPDEQSGEVRRSGRGRPHLVGRIGLPVAPTSHNWRYLRTEQLRMGHLVDRGGTSSEVRELRGRASGAGTSRTAGGTRAAADA